LTFLQSGKSEIASVEVVSVYKTQIAKPACH